MTEQNWTGQNNTEQNAASWGATDQGAPDHSATGWGADQGAPEHGATGWNATDPGTADWTAADTTGLRSTDYSADDTAGLRSTDYSAADWNAPASGSVAMPEAEIVLPFTRKEIMKARHKREGILFVICVFINIIIVGSLIAQGISSYAIDPFMYDTIEDLYYYSGMAGANGVAILSMFVVMLIYTLYMTYARVRAQSIRVTEDNFPEIYYKSIELARLLRLRKVPPVYITQGNGIINAFASAVIGRRYALLHAEIVEVAYLEHKDFEAVYFVLAHEFAHIYLKHVTLLNNLLILFSRMVPVLGHMLSRAREYSCDRIAQLITGCDFPDGIMILYAGRHLYKYVDVNAYLSAAKKEKGFFLWLTHVLSTHPIAPKRIAALIDPQKKSGRLL